MEDYRMAISARIRTYKSQPKGRKAPSSPYLKPATPVGSQNWSASRGQKSGASRAEQEYKRLEKEREAKAKAKDKGRK
jgi:hypothetical protein